MDQSLLRGAVEKLHLLWHGKTDTKTQTFGLVQWLVYCVAMLV